MRTWTTDGKLFIKGLDNRMELMVTDAGGKVIYTGKAVQEQMEINLPQTGIYYLSIKYNNGKRIVRAIKY